MPRSLSIAEFSDREFLLIVQEAEDADGWSSSHEVAKRVSGLETAEPHRSVANRLSWLWRFGAVEREYVRDEHGQLVLTRGGKPKLTQRWKLSPLGEAMANGQLRAAQQRSLEAMNEGQLFTVTRWLTEQYRANRGQPVGLLVRRVWTHGTHKRRFE
jgi:hypothetical protein